MYYLPCSITGSAAIEAGVKRIHFDKEPKKAEVSKTKTINLNAVASEQWKLYFEKQKDLEIKFIDFTNETCMLNSQFLKLCKTQCGGICE